MTRIVNGPQYINVVAFVAFDIITDDFLNDPMTAITRKYLLVESQNVIRSISYKLSFVFKKLNKS